ncbi:MAG: histidine phosphatase family protein [Chloroflexi bacterium]|nr:histidine phosphatase family protein [Chloroflexota bacterium]
MKLLLLMRHAKSSWDPPYRSDFERPLAKRGLRDAPLMGEFLAETRYRPQLIISSPAMRARMTAERAAAAMNLEDNLRFDDRIYLAAARDLLQVAAELPDDIERAMLVGHNPGFEDAVEALCRGSVRMPTAAVACIALDIEHWRDIARAAGVLQWLLIPKLLLRK